MTFSRARRMPKQTKVSRSLNVNQKKAVKKIVKTAIKDVVEDKQVFGALANYNPDFTGTIVPLIMPPIGTADSQRVGDSCKFTRIRLYGEIYGGNTHLMRIIVFQWHPDNTTTVPTAGHILNGAVSGSTNFIHSTYTHDYNNLYTILADKMYNISATGSQLAVVKINISGKRCRKPQFIQGTVAGTNIIYCLLVQDGLVTLNTLAWNQTLDYVDA